IGVNEIEGVFHTHSHDDHFAGLTTLMQADRRIKYFAVPMVRAAVTKKLSALLSIEERDFEHYFDIRDLVMDEWNEVNGLGVKPIFSPHPVETTIFSFRALAEGGYRSYAHFADIAALKVLEGMLVEDDSKAGLSRKLFDKVAADYVETATIKKIDIGGGMIHGDAADFATDSSEKIILAHTAQRLTDQQKRFGSGASFGTVDVLINSHRDFLGRAAHNFLHVYFPTVPANNLGALINGPILTFNPETILLKGGKPHSSIYLLLTGLVEVLDEHSDFRTQLSAGALLGEMSGLYSLPTSETYRAISFVQVLEIPCDLYIAFVRHHRLFENISRLMEGREFLSRTWLMGGVVSTSTLNAIATDMRLKQVAAGEKLNRWERSVGLIIKGRITRTLGNEVLETLEAGDFFGEEAAVFDAPPIAGLHAEIESEIYMISPKLLAGIPNVRWKLFESFERRAHMELSASQSGRCMLVWHDEYSVNIQRIDVQHRRLFATANALLEVLESDRGQAEVSSALDFLLDYAQHHFAEEEDVMRLHDYPQFAAHAQAHKLLMAQVREQETLMRTGNAPSAAELLEFLRGWIIHHVLIDDRKYAAYLNEKGVF
ncbi:MAG TPA: bacteriohemerythrin, partial [Rhodospirillaceae bacterium]|nr:bacteriohemerythrin [Rhodospirillaceae bacterium]